MDSQKAYSLAFSEKKNSLTAKQSAYDEKKQMLYEENDEYRKIADRLAVLGPQITVCTFSGDQKKLETIKKEAEKLREEKNALLIANGVLPVTFDCDVCKDTGYVGGKICECVRQLASKIMLKDAGNFAPIENSTFLNFDLSYYSDKETKGTTPKKRMSGILEFTKKYASDFNPKTSESLLFMGNTGVGKTHLSLAIFNELIKNGFNVIYKPAFNLFSDIESEHFNKNSKDNYDAALDCDLLIIDDLGSEFASSYVLSVIYNIINSRILSGKPTIISTNLTIKEIETKYTPRVSSRIIGNYTAKGFLGNDIRQIKKLS
ncbi:MAG: ATP-binding protein [Clostridia bacterium]|nr:ATP-binding protein [Clostridia bacterium]